MYEDFDIRGKVAFVTGGTSGLGRAIAMGLANAGACVFVGSRDAVKVAEARAALQALDARNDAFELDVTDARSSESAFATVVERMGRLDILVNAAGITMRGAALDVTPDDWDNVLRINLTGTFLSCQAAGRIMTKQEGGGAIVNVASLASYRGWSLVAAYGASKAAVVELTQTLAVEWAPHRIRVNAVAPGVFPTPLNRSLIEGTPRGRWFKMLTPMDRFGDPEELVGAVIFLCSPAARYITGETLAVDGGFLAMGVPADPRL